MSAYTGELVLRHPGADCPFWRLASSFAYEVGHLGSGRVIEVPIGFETDGATIPRLLWIVDPPIGRAVRAALIHDFLVGQLQTDEPHPEALTRAAADAVFHEALIAAGLSRSLAWLMWAAVRVFGRGAGHDIHPRR